MKKILIIFSFFWFFLFPFCSIRAFDTYVAHPLLTRHIAQIYNQTSIKPITAEEIEWLTQGSLEEDEPIIRAFNHFYNPLKKDGLRLAGIRLGLPSPEWAHASTTQRFSEGGDCSWPTAVAAYKAGDKAKGIRCLGHILHLLEDASVPAHTRNDQHLTGDSFEEWTKFHRPMVSRETSAVTPHCTTDQACIIEMARWINSHFLSEDTISDKDFPLPFKDATVENGYLMYDQRVIALYHPGRRKFVLTSDIMADYWEVISPVIAVYGERLINLFFDEVGVVEFNEDQTSQSYTEFFPAVNLDNTLPSSSVTPSVLSAQELGNSSQIPSTRIKPQSGLSSTNESVIKSNPTSNSTSVSLPLIKEPTNSLVTQPIFSVITPTINPQIVSGRGNSISSTLPDTYLTSRPASRTNSQQVEFIIASNISDVYFECRLDDEDWSVCPSIYQRDHMSEGSHSFRARAVNSTGPDSSPIQYSWVIDITPPLSYLISEVNHHSREARFVFSSEAEAQFDCRLDNQEWQTCLSPQAYRDLTAGTHVFLVRARDQVGNIEKISSAYTWEIEIDPPSPPVVEFPVSSPYYTKENFIVFSGQTETGTEVWLNNTREEVNQTDTTWISEQVLVTGENRFNLVARNQYGESSEEIELLVIMDDIAPTASITNLPEISETADFMVYWQGIDNEPVELLRYDVQFMTDNEDWHDWQTNMQFTQNLFTNALLNQTISFRARARDMAGNIGEWSEVVTTRFAPGWSENVLISQVVIKGEAGSQDEFIELYNPTDRTIYLADYTVEKKAATGLFWQTVVDSNQFNHMIIQPHGYFLITGRDYNYQTRPDIKSNLELLYDNGGHVRLLDSGGEEIDRLGYGGASQSEGLAAPLPEIGFSLERKAHYSSTAVSLRLDPEAGNGYDSDFNYFDFVLQSAILPRASDFQAGPINLNNNLAHLWHFDECGGQTVDSISNRSYVQPTTWIVGPYGCALSQNWPAYEDISWTFNEPLVGPEITVSFYVRELGYGSRSYIWFANSSGAAVVGIRANRLGDEVWYQGQAIPQSSALPGDGQWHQMAAVFNQNYLAWYRDGVLVNKLVGDYSWSQPVTNIQIGEDNLPWQFDELAVWQESLSQQEIIALGQKQLSPHLIRPAQPLAQLKHFWNFNEGGTIATDSIGGKEIQYHGSVVGHSGQAYSIYWYHHPQVLAPISNINSKDLSLSYWWHRSSIGAGGGLVGLYSSNTSIIFGSGGGYLESYYLLNGNSGGLGTQLPDDDNWHHVAIVYDSYQYKLKYYIDGIEKSVLEMIWPYTPYDRLFIKEDQLGFYLDDLKIWEGALTADQVQIEANTN